MAAPAAALGPSQDFPGPQELVARLRAGDLRQTSLTVRLGSAGPVPLTVPLDAGVTVVRADDDVAAAVATWVICQAVAGHPARALCLAAALAPTPTRNWLWLNWLPNARPDTPPLAGTPDPGFRRRPAPPQWTWPRGSCRVSVGGRVADGVPDLVPSGYDRDVADLLPDS